MVSVNVLDARNNLSKLVAAAAEGDDVVISKRGRPIVRLVPVAPEGEQNTGSQIASWMTRNPPPGYSERTLAQLDEQIRAERGSWE